MAYRVTIKEFENVSKFLEIHLPDSVIVYEVLSRMMSDHDPGFQVWASKKSGSNGYNVIVISADPIVCKNPYYRPVVTLFCIDPTEIVHTLSFPGVLNFSEDIYFFVVMERDMYYISSMEVWSKYQVTTNLIHHHFWCTDEHDVPKCAIPDGFSQSLITTDIANTIIMTNRDRDRPGSEETLKELIKWNFPSICLYSNSGIPVAWARKKFWGDMGSVFVHPSYRRIGLGKYVVTELAKQLLEIRGSVFARIEDGNEISESLHETAGFRKYDKHRLITRKYSTKK